MSFVLSRQEGYLLTLTLNRPEALNALNGQVFEDLDRALDQVDLSTVRCLILTGAGVSIVIVFLSVMLIGKATKAIRREENGK